MKANENQPKSTKGGSKVSQLTEKLKNEISTLATQRSNTQILLDQFKEIEETKKKAQDEMHQICCDTVVAIVSNVAVKKSFREYLEGPSTTEPCLKFKGKKKKEELAFHLLEAIEWGGEENVSLEEENWEIAKKKFERFKKDLQYIASKFGVEAYYNLGHIGLIKRN